MQRITEAEYRVHRDGRSQLADGRYQCGNAIVEIGTAVCLASLRDRRMYRADKHTGGFTDREVRTGWCVRGAGKAVLV